MRCFVYVVFFFSVLSGCADPTLGQYSRLEEQWGIELGRLRPHLVNLEPNERRIRLRFEQSRDMANMLRAYVKSEPELNPKLARIVNDWIAVNAEIQRIHEQMIAANRFTYEDTEQQRAEGLITAEAFAGADLIQFLEEL